MIPTSVHSSTFANRPAKTAPGYGRANTRPRTDPVATALAIAGLIAVAAIHLGQVVPTVKQTPYLGALFILLVVACVGLAACLLESDRSEVWSAVAVVNGLAIAGYVFTRAVSSFIDNQDVGNWGETLGLVALLVEGVLILLSLHALRGQRIPRGARA